MRMVSYSSFRPMLRTILRGAYFYISALETERLKSAGMFFFSMFAEILLLKSGNCVPSILGLSDSKA